MLQSVKASSAAPPQDARLRDSRQGAIEPHFSGILAHLVTGTALPAPAPAPALAPRSCGEASPPGADDPQAAASSRSPEPAGAARAERPEEAPDEPERADREAETNGEAKAEKPSPETAAAPQNDAPDKIADRPQPAQDQQAAPSQDAASQVIQAQAAAGPSKTVMTGATEAAIATEATAAAPVGALQAAQAAPVASAETAPVPPVPQAAPAAAAAKTAQAEPTPGVQATGTASVPAPTPAAPATEAAAVPNPPLAKQTAEEVAESLAPGGTLQTPSPQASAKSAQSVPSATAPAPQEAAQPAKAQVQAPAPSFGRAEASQEQSASALKFQYQPSGPVPVEKASWAELLYVPRVDVETPRHLMDAVSRPQASVQGQSQSPAAESAARTPEAGTQAQSQDQGASTLAQGALASASLPRSEAKAAGQGFHTQLQNLTGAGSVATEGAPVKGVQASTPTASLVMPKSTPLFSQVDGSIRWMLKNGSQSAELQLSPESLGKLSVQLRVERGEVHARLIASEAGTVPLLQSHRTYLENSLKAQGLHLASFDLQQGSRGGNREPVEQQAPSASAPSSGESSEAKQEVPSVSATLLASPYRIEVVA